MKRFLLMVAVVILAIGILPFYSLKAEEAEEDKDLKTSLEESDSEVYNSTKEKVWNEKNGTLGSLFDELEENGEAISGSEPVKKIWVFIFYVYDVISAVYPILLFASILLGVLVAVLSTRNKKRRKFAIAVCCITIPVLLTMVVYVLPYLYLRLS